jgi:Holliday junction resolvase
MPTNSRQKGKRGEREVAEILRELGFAKARRSVQYSGRPAPGQDEGAGDLHGVEGVSIEVKHRERYGRADLQQWLERTAEDSGSSVPIVVHRSNRVPWMATFWLYDIVKLANALVEAWMQLDDIDIEAELSNGET